MPAQDEMDITERFKYLRIMYKRYMRANREERGRLLDEMEKVTGLHRKALVRQMKKAPVRQARAKQRERTYGPEVGAAVHVIAESLDYIAPERLTPNLVWLATHLASHGELKVTDELLVQLQEISFTTVRRLLRHLQRDEPRLPHQGPQGAHTAAHDIPMRKIPWDESEPGHFELDTVHHCGRSSTGEYVYTVQMIDVATGWSERMAVLGRSYLVMSDSFRRIMARLPFPILELHPDNGSEFLNAHLIHFWGETVKGVQLSRSRPFHKNDNRFVEQKNYTLVRAYLGHERLDTVAQVKAVNQLYDKMWLYYNFFQPVMRLSDKTWVTDADGSRRLKRTFDQAQTPFDRLCATQAITPARRRELQQLREQTNPRRLRQEIHELISSILSLPNATPGITEDVLATLSAPIPT